MYSGTEVDRIFTHVQRLTGYVLGYRGWQDIYSGTEVDRMCTHVQRMTGYVLGTHVKRW